MTPISRRHRAARAASRSGPPPCNVRVLWDGDRLLVSQGEATVAVDPTTGRVTPRQYAGSGLVAGVRSEAPTLDLVNSGTRWTVRAWSGPRLLDAVDVLTLPTGAVLVPRPAGCCAVLGWLDRHTVLVSMSGLGRPTGGPHWIPAWDLDTGRVLRVSKITAPEGRLTLSVMAPAGS